MLASSGKKKAAIGVGVAAVALGAFVALRARGGDDGAPGFQTAEAARGRIAAQVTATGTLSPVVEVQVGSQVSGRIASLGADFNDRVTKGQVIATIDPQLFETEVARARANLTVAQASVERAEAELRDAKQKSERADAMVREALVAQADADTAKASFDAAAAGVASAKAQLSQARAALSQAQTNLGYTTIVSPIDGVVISRDVDVGQTVAASLQAPTVFTIAEDLAKMEVHTSVAESDVGSLTTGMAVEFTVDAFPQDRFRGTVKQVRYSPTTVSNVVTYDAVVAVENPDLKLRPGMTANVTFVIEERADALGVPNAALRYRPSPAVLARYGYDEAQLKQMFGKPSEGKPADGERPATEGKRRTADGKRAPADGERPTGDAQAADGKRDRRPSNRRMVWRLGADGRPTPVPIETGISDGRTTEVVGGELAPGDRLITGVEGEEAAPTTPGNQGGARRGPPRFL
jgi:HlyD family secretion protein